MKNVLVFPCGSEIGLEIYKSASSSTHFRLFGGSTVQDHGEYVYENYISNLPHVDDEDFIQKLNKVIDEYHIDFIFPAHDSVVLKLSEEAFKGRIKCTVISSSFETCSITRSKKNTYEYFDGVIPTPEVYSSIDEISLNSYPIFVKPDVGQGSKGAYKVNNPGEAAFYAGKDPSILYLEYLPGKEYTIDCFTNRNKELLYSTGRRRTRISNGISVSSHVVDDERFGELAEKINDKVIFRGAWFFQVKEDVNGRLVLMEVAPRIAGTMGLSRARGVNLVLLSLFDAMGYDVHVKSNDYDVTIDRALENKYIHDIAYTHVYIDLDDTLILNGNVNTAAIALVYQSLNRGKKVHLITRHSDDLSKTLKEYRLLNIFDSVLWLKEGERKSAFIKETDAIFIDDSYAERNEVQEIRGIPVFDSHMIETLMEKD